MKRKPFWPSVLVFGLLAAVAAGGCAKKQVVAEGETQAAEPREERPVRQPPPVVTEEPLRREPAEPPPTRTAAVEPAPEEPIEGEGLARDTTPGLERIHFDFDQYNLTNEARETLADNSDYLQASQGLRVRIEGHCDERGTVEYNLALGERRARSAYQYLMDLGVDPNRMSVVSYGEEAPLDPRHNEEAWAMNRRAEFVEIQ